MKPIALIPIAVVLVLACQDVPTTSSLPTDQSLLEIPGSAGTLMASCAVPTSGLLSWWPGDGNANDVQGGHHATMTNGATFAPGIIGQAFSLDGVDDWVRIVDFGFPTATQFTIAAWIWIDGTGSQPAATFRTIYLSDSRGVSIYNPDVIGGQGFRLNWWPAGAELLLGDSEIPVGEWKHIAMTYDGATFIGYLDGISDLVGSVAGQHLPGAGGGLGIGRHQSEPFKGLIDEVRVYDRPLSPAEASALACVSPADQVDAMGSAVADLVTSGALDEGNGTALQVTLANASKALANDRPNVPNLLNAFINQVEGFVNGGTLSPAEGQVLVDAAQALINQLES